MKSSRLIAHGERRARAPRAMGGSSAIWPVAFALVEPRHHAFTHMNMICNMTRQLHAHAPDPLEKRKSLKRNYATTAGRGATRSSSRSRIGAVSTRRDTPAVRFAPHTFSCLSSLAKAYGSTSMSMPCTHDAVAETHFDTPWHVHVAQTTTTTGRSHDDVRLLSLPCFSSGQRLHHASSFARLPDYDFLICLAKRRGFSLAVAICVLLHHID